VDKSDGARVGSTANALSLSGCSGLVWCRSDVVRFNLAGQVQVVLGCQDQEIRYDN